MKRNLALVWFLAACDQAPDHAREWTPADHDQAELQGRQAMQQQAPQGRPTPQASLAELTWSENCAACHGPVGHGDGPNGPLVRAPDLTREEWQKSVTDADIKERIQNGKGLMPKFDIPEAALTGVIARIRASRGSP